MCVSVRECVCEKKTDQKAPFVISNKLSVHLHLGDRACKYTTN